MKFGHKGRLEDARMLKGQGRYVADWNLPGQAYGHFLRSDRPHARIMSIDASQALALPGVIAVLTGEDVQAAGYQPLPAAAPMKGRGGARRARRARRKRATLRAGPGRSRSARASTHRNALPAHFESDLESPHEIRP